MKCRTKYAEKPPSARNSRSVVSGSSSFEPVDRPAAPAPAGGSGDLREHPEVRRPRQVVARGEQAAPAQRAGPLQAGPVVADRHRHLGLLGRDPELGEQAEQHRVGAAVVHDEAGVDRVSPSARRGLLDEVGVGVAAEPVVGLVEGDVRGPGRDVRRGQPGDAGADHGQPAGGRLGMRSHQAFSNGNRATGSEVGSVDPAAGSTVIPAATALATSPSSTTVRSSASIRPAGTMPSRLSCSHIS